MYSFKKIGNIIFIFYIIAIILIGSIIRIIAFNNNVFFIPLDDCHSLGDFDSLTFKDCFTVFLQGANFLPLYKALLFSIYKICGFNFFFLKLPSLIASILILPLSFTVLKKIFNNKFIIISILTIIALNFNLIYFSYRIKPYEFDVLFSLLILNTVLSLNSNIPLKNIFKYALSSVFIIFFSIPAIVLIEMYWSIIFLKNIIQKAANNIKNLLIFQLITAPFLILEYFLYINQINQDTGLKNQWLTDMFYYSPKSLEAVNALIQFIYFKFFWWDTVDVPIFKTYTIIIILTVFILGSIICILNSLKNKELKDIFIISPVYTFLLLSYLGLYPFCNRCITFLIPFIIFITFKIFDSKINKIINVFLNLMVIIYISLFIKHIFNIGEIQNIMFNDFFYKKTFPVINTLKNASSNREIIITFKAVCAPCLENTNMCDIRDFIINGNNKNFITYFDKRKNGNIETDNINTIIKNKKYVYFAISENSECKEQELIENAILNQGYFLADEKQSPFINYKLFKLSSNEKE